MNVRYRVELSQVERSDLKALLSGGKHASRKLKRADSGDCGQGFRLNATMRSDRMRPPVPTKAAGVSLPA